MKTEKDQKIQYSTKSGKELEEVSSTLKFGNVDTEGLSYNICIKDIIECFSLKDSDKILNFLEKEVNLSFPIGTKVKVTNNGLEIYYKNSVQLDGIMIFINPKLNKKEIFLVHCQDDDARTDIMNFISYVKTPEDTYSIDIKHKSLSDIENFQEVLDIFWEIEKRLQDYESKKDSGLFFWKEDYQSFSKLAEENFEDTIIYSGYNIESGEIISDFDSAPDYMRNQLVYKNEKIREILSKRLGEDFPSTKFCIYDFLFNGNNVQIMVKPKYVKENRNAIAHYFDYYNSGEDLKTFKRKVESIELISKFEYFLSNYLINEEALTLDYFAREKISTITGVRHFLTYDMGRFLFDNTIAKLHLRLYFGKEDQSIVDKVFSSYENNKVDHVLFSLKKKLFTIKEKNEPSNDYKDIIAYDYFFSKQELEGLIKNFKNEL